MMQLMRLMVSRVPRAVLVREAHGDWCDGPVTLITAPVLPSLPTWPGAEAEGTQVLPGRTGPGL